MLSIDLSGKLAFVAGVGDDRGYGWAICKALAAAGARVCVGTWPPVLNIFRKSLERGKLDLALPGGGELAIEKVYPLDALFDLPEDVPAELREDKRYKGLEAFTVQEVADALARDHGSPCLDVLVHSLANGPEVQKSLLETSRAGYLGAVSASAYSLVSMVQRFGPLLRDGAGVVSLTYLASERAVPGYGGGMSSAKAALESDTRTLAFEAGRKWRVRVNTISAGPLASRAARAIGKIDRMVDYYEENSAMGGVNTAMDVGHAATFLCSPLAGGISGSVVYVDRGFHAMGMTAASQLAPASEPAGSGSGAAAGAPAVGRVARLERSLPFGRQLPRLLVPPPGSESRARAQRLRAVESRNVTFVGDDVPVFWDEAAGANVRDVDGNIYLDLGGAFGVAFAGHSLPRAAEAVSDQAARLSHGMGDVHPATPKLALLERLAELAPWPDARVVLATSGSEAVEVALKTALLATGRPGLLAFEGGYHGLTLGSLAVTDREAFRAPFAARLYGGVARAPFPGAGDEEGRARALEVVERALADGVAGGDRVGAVIVEPVQGRAGVRVPAAGFLAAVAERARAAGALLVLDEVMTGFGRTGRLFAHEHEGVVPDLLCVGKALGGGQPLSACLGPAAVMDAWPPSTGEALHTSTFMGHPVACAAALAFLAELEREGLVGRAERLGALLLEGLSRGLQGVPGVVEVRGRGLLVGVELDADGTAAEVAGRALRAGLLVLPAGERGEVVELAPPAILTEAQMDHAVDGVTEVVRRWAQER